MDAGPRALLGGESLVAYPSANSGGEILNRPLHVVMALTCIGQASENLEQHIASALLAVRERILSIQASKMPFQERGQIAELFRCRSLLSKRRQFPCG